MHTNMTTTVELQQAWDELAAKLTPRRKARMEAVAKARTRWLRLVVQDIHHPHNVSACLRSAEAFGIQDVHIVTLRETFRPSEVAQGVSGWLRIHKHDTVEDCVAALVDAGYRIIAGLPPHLAQTTLAKVPVNKPTAIVFGNEHKGIDDSWQRYLNESFTIPMSGMVESLNISVSAAISLYDISSRARAEVASKDYFFSDLDQLKLLNNWAAQQLNR